MKHPRHITGFVRDASDFFSDEADDNHCFFEVICRCGQSALTLWKSERPTLKAVCAVCRTEIMVYDLTHYPAASKKTKDDEFLKVFAPGGIDQYPVYVMYEYGELDDGETFDPDDITWCQVFIRDQHGIMHKVLDDETA